MRRMWEEERGVAMTEAVVVLPFFMVLWMGLVALHNLWDARLEAQAESWGDALAASRAADCQGDPRSMVAQLDAAPGGDAALDAVQDEHSGAGTALSAAGVLPFAFRHLTGTASREASGIPVPLGGPTRMARGRNKVMCNMQPQEGLFDVVVNFIEALLE